MATTTNGIYYPNDYNAAADIPSDLKTMAESIDKNIQDNNYDDTEIKQDIQELQSDILDIKSEQETQNDLLQRTQNALINITTPKSSNINVKDSSDLNAKIDVFGISEQETRSGINLTNYKEWVGLSTKEQITKKDDDEIICTITDSSYGVRDIERILKPNTNYTACVDSKFSGNLESQYGLRVNINGSTTSLKADGLVNFTTDETGKAEMRYYVGFPYSGENATLTVSNIRLYEGTYTRENIPDYEQYGASPSPEYPSEIKNITGNIDITVCNKNIFNKENYDALSDYAVQMEGNMSSYKGKLLQLKPNTTYAVSRLINNFDASGSWVLRILDADKVTPLAILQELSYTSDIKVTITTGETGIVYIAELYATDERLQDFFSECEIQIEENNSSTDFIPHKEQTITFPLSEGQKLYDKDYPASDGIHHVRKQIELVGTENWFKNETTKIFGFALSDIKTEGAFNSSAKIVVMSSYFKAAKYYQLYYGEVDEAISGHDSSRAVELRATRFTTIEELKTWLTEQKEAGTPVILEYELAEEEIEPYTDEQQEAYDKLQNVLSYYNVTNVFTDKAQLVFKYIADTKTYVDNQYNALANQVLEIAGGN